MKKCVILNDTSYDFHHGCEIVMSNIIKLLKEIDIETIDTNPVGINWKTNKKFMQNMINADIVIVNGEGTLHHNAVRVKELVSVGKYVKENLDVPIVLINTTYQDNGSEIAEYMKFFDLIFVRETMSQNDLKQFNIESSVVPDMTFYTKFNLSSKSINNSIGTTDSVYDNVSKSLYDLSIKNRYQYLPALTTPYIKEFNKIVVFKTIKFYLRKTVRYVQWKLFGRLDIILMGTYHYIEDYKSYIQQISSLNFIFIGRYHSLCFALKTLTPFFAIKSNSHKVESMLGDIGIEHDRIVDDSDLDNLKFKPFSKEEEIQIKTYINHAPIEIEAMFQEIKKLLLRDTI